MGEGSPAAHPADKNGAHLLSGHLLPTFDRENSVEPLIPTIFNQFSADRLAALFLEVSKTRLNNFNHTCVESIAAK